MSALVAGLAVVAVLVWVVRPTGRRAGRPTGRLTGREPAAGVTDGPSRLLGWAVGVLPADRAPWGEAMFGELQAMRNRRQRWRFAAGCAGAAILLPSRRADFAGLAVRLVAATALACAGLVAYGLAHFPEILTLPGTRSVLAIFVFVLAAYTMIAAILVRRGPVARSGLVYGLGLGLAWIITGIPVAMEASSPLTLLAVPTASLAVGILAARRSSTIAVRQQIVLFSALVAGLVSFLAYAGYTLLTAGGPYDSGQIRDFPGSGLPDLATYAVNDNLGTTMMLLLLVPAVSAAIGSVAAVVAGPRRTRH